MKYILITVLLTFFIFFSLKGQTDSLVKIIPDDYPVTDDMFKAYNFERRNAKEYLDDNLWFSNDSLKQTLVFNLYTDYHRFLIYHFLNEDIPDEIFPELMINNLRREFTVNDFKDWNLEQKIKIIKDSNLVNHKIKPSFFTTNKGFSLGDKKEKAISIYGEPDSCYTSRRNKICEWNFIGEYAEIPTNGKYKKTLAKNSFGFKVTMFYRKDRLIGMILFNDIP